MADSLADKIRSLGYKPSYNLKSFRERVDEALALLTKEPAPSTANLILFGQACERLKWDATEVDHAIRQDVSARFDLATEVDTIVKATSEKIS